MKKVKLSEKNEPTLGEFFDFVKEKFETTETRFDDLQQSIDTRFVAMNERIDNVDARLGDVHSKLVKVENRVEDIQDDLASALHSSDNDGVAILNHEHRISHLEKLGGIKSAPPKHLVELE